MAAPHKSRENSDEFSYLVEKTLSINATDGMWLEMWWKGLKILEKIISNL